jgi:D-beta-D-heptose 7-phosphate kinase/D-beta-D-heptose 1-phosphate adenosyltransferase
MKTLVFTAGCFDSLHKGHLKLLTEARTLGDLLIVSINRDEYLARKGPGRPIRTEAERVRDLYQTGLIDEVVVHGDSPLEWVVKLKPDVIVVGDDYTEETTVGAREIKEWNGRVHIVEKIPGVSTTAILEEAK